MPGESGANADPYVGLSRPTAMCGRESQRIAGPQFQRLGRRSGDWKTRCQGVLACCRYDALGGTLQSQPDLQTTNCEVLSGIPEIPQVPVVTIPMRLTTREDFAIEGIGAARFDICSWARHPFHG
jgi:hypothetical protein